MAAIWARKERIWGGDGATWEPDAPAANGRALAILARPFRACGGAFRVLALTLTSYIEFEVRSSRLAQYIFGMGNKTAEGGPHRAICTMHRMVASPIS